MIKIIDLDSEEEVGQMNEEHYKFLMDSLEEEGGNDTNYFFTTDTITMLEDKGADENLTHLLRKILGPREEMELDFEMED